MHEANPQIVGIRLENLKPEVRSYIQKLRASLQVIYDKYEVTNRDELAAKVRTGIVKQEDIDKAIELMQVINECGKENKAFYRYREFEHELIEEEKRQLEAFFGRPIGVPPLPDEITPERIEKWKEQRLELHYLPPIDMGAEKNLKKWRQPNYKSVRIEKENPTMLPGCWVLIDARQKPLFDRGDQMYEDDDDFLGPVLENLREKGLISKFKHAQSRFNVLPKDLRQPEVIAAIAQACGLKPEQLSLPRMIEANILGNIHHPEWRRRNACSERLTDGSKGILRNGAEGCGTAEDEAFWNEFDSMHSVVGFRPIGRFS